jgi:hypothetical protein
VHYVLAGGRGSSGAAGFVESVACIFHVVSMQDEHRLRSFAAVAHLETFMEAQCSTRAAGIR